MKKHLPDDVITVEVALTLVSDKARAVYDWVVDYHVNNGISPVRRDVSVGLGMSLTNVNHHVNMLKKFGLMRRGGYRVNRAIVVAGGKFSVDRTALIFPPSDTGKGSDKDAGHNGNSIKRTGRGEGVGQRQSDSAGQRPD